MDATLYNIGAITAIPDSGEITFKARIGGFMCNVQIPVNEGQELSSFQVLRKRINPIAVPISTKAIFPSTTRMNNLAPPPLTIIHHPNK